MKHEEFFRTHPVFTKAELAEHMASGGGASSRARESLLSYHKKSGRVIPVRRGLYAVVPPGSAPEWYLVDPYLVAAKLTADAVISHHTALQFHGLAQSVMLRFTYTASRTLSPFNFQGLLYRGVRLPEALRRAHCEETGVVTRYRSGMDVSVTTVARTMVDMLNKPELSGGWKETWRSLESVGFFDLDQVTKYVMLLENATAAARVGFFLEQHREVLAVHESHLKALRNMRPRQPHYLNRSRQKPGRLIPDWNLVIPARVR